MEVVNEAREFKVALCGFTDREQKSIGSAFKLSAVRPRNYVRWEKGRGRPDICVVNDDLPTGALEWIDIRRDILGALCPVIRIGLLERPAEPFEDVTSVFIKRPVLANRILKGLDDLVTDVFHFAPELAIHDDMPTNLIPDRIEPPASATTDWSRRILVVDDSEPVRRMMHARLARDGFAVDFAATGEEALIKARQQPYALIFLDVMLPGINGFEVSRILKRDPEQHTPVVMLTSKSSRIDRFRGSLASADAYLTKPVSIASLNDTLKRFLH